MAFHHCSLLLDRKHFPEVNKRLKFLKKIENSPDFHLNVALDKGLRLATSGSLLCHQNMLSDSKKVLLLAEKNLRKAGQNEYLLYGLLLQAKTYLKSQEFSNSQQSLQETYEVAIHSGMRLHLTDYHLEMTRLILAVEADPNQYPEAAPYREKRILPFADQEEPGILTLEGHINEAAKLIEETGYHRRDAELTELKQQAGMI